MMPHLTQHFRGGKADQRLVVNQQNAGPARLASQFFLALAQPVRPTFHLREPDFGCRTLANLASNLKTTARLSRKAVNHRQPKSSSFPLALGCEEWLHRPA